jgi:hypothetical protein
MACERAVHHPTMVTLPRSAGQRHRIDRMEPIPQQPVKPSSVGRVAGWIAIGMGIGITALGLFEAEWAAIVVGLGMVLAVYASRFWISGNVLNAHRRWPPK